MTTQAPAEQEGVRLISPHASYWLSISTNVDTYSEMGGMRTNAKGRRVQFVRGQAIIPPELVEEVKANRYYGKDFWLADDVLAPVKASGSEGPRVVSGQATGASRAKAREPLPGWDEEAPRALRARIESGAVADPEAALLYEAQNRKRAQVMTALGRLLEADEDDAELPATVESGVIAPVPNTAKVD